MNVRALTAAAALFSTITAACASSPTTPSTIASPSAFALPSASPSAVVLPSASPPVSSLPPVSKVPSAEVSSLPPTQPPQVYVAAAELIDAADSAILVKDCPAIGACGFRVDATSDGGASWRRGGALPVSGANGSPATDDGVTGLAMVSPTEVYAYGSSLWHSTDAGATWVQMPGVPALDTVVSDHGSIWLRVACAELAGCSSSIDTLIDGQVAPLAHQVPGDVREVVRHGATAYAVTVTDGGSPNYLWVSNDDGNSWRRTDLPQDTCGFELGAGSLVVTASGDLYDVCAAGASAGSEQKTLFAYDNASHRWRQVAVLETYGYADSMVAATSAIFWRYGGRAPVYRSLDGGRSWQPVLADRLGDNAGPETQAFAASGLVAMAFGYDASGAASDPAFDGPWLINEYLTADAGRTWRTIALNP